MSSLSRMIKLHTQYSKRDAAASPAIARGQDNRVRFGTHPNNFVLTNQPNRGDRLLLQPTSHLRSLQRQVLAAEIGQRQGNHHLSQLITHLKIEQRKQGALSDPFIQRQLDPNAATTLTQAIASGIHNENRLTDLLFFARHPERNQQPLDPQHETALVQEWLTIRNHEVRPALLLPAQAPPTAAPESSTALQQAIRNGIRNEVQLSDTLFFARHPERNGRAIDAKHEPHFVQEWLTLRDQVVRPALAQTQAAHTTLMAPVAAPSPDTVSTPVEQAGSQSLKSTDTPKKQSATELIASLNHNKLRQLDEIMQTLQRLQTAAEAPPTTNQSQQERTLWWQNVWRQMSDTSQFAHYKEPGAATVKQMTQLLHMARALTNSLTQEELSVDAGALAKIKGEYQRRLNAFTPYYTQMANLNLLWYNGAIHYDAWMQTCNVTSLAMTFQAAGIATTDFAGDPALLTQIAQRYDSRLQSFADLATLRMPDFLQLVIIYLKFGETAGTSFEQHVDQARGIAARVISTTLEIFAQAAALFGVERTHVGYIRSTGEQTFAKSGGEVPTEQFRQAVQTQLTPWLDAGGQVIVNQPGHYTRLEDITDSGLVLDDPAKRGKNYRVSWADANRIGYFRSYQVFMKK